MTVVGRLLDPPETVFNDSHKRDIVDVEVRFTACKAMNTIQDGKA
jgi:hypothetical protein